MNLFKRLFRVLKDQRGFGLSEVFLPALIEGISSIAIEDVAAGALIGGGVSGLEGGNIFTGALEGAAGGAFGDVIEGSGVLSGIGDALGNAADSVGNFFGIGGDAAGDSLGVSGGVADAATTGAPSSAIGGAGSTATGAVTSPSNISGLTDTNISSALNNSSDLGTSGASLAGSSGGDAASSLTGGSGTSFSSPAGSGVGSGANAAIGGSNFSGISGADIGGFQNAPNVGGISGSAASKGIESAGGEFEGGGGFGWDKASNALQSSSASSADIFSSGPSLEAGGGILSSTGVKPVDNSLLSQAGDFLGKIPAKAAAPAASLAYQALSGPPKLPAAERALLSEDQTLAQNQMNEYNTGVLQPGQQAQLDTSKQNAINQLYQQFASMGVTNPQGDTRFQQGLQQIDQQIQNQKQGFLDSSLKAADGTGSQIESIAKDQMAQDTAYSDQVSAASQALFSLLGSGG